MPNRKKTKYIDKKIQTIESKLINLDGILTGRPKKADLSHYESHLNSQIKNIDNSTQNNDMALDATNISYINNNYDLNDSLILNNSFIGFPQLSLFAQVPIIYNVCHTYTHEMLRMGFEFVSISETDDKTDTINLLKEKFKEFEIDKLLRKALMATFQLGGAMIYPKLKGDDTNLINGRKERETKLIISEETIKKGDVEYFTVIEPSWCNPINTNYSDPFASDFYIPSNYNVMGRTIHASRLIKLVYNELPNIVKPIYLFYGLSLTQKILSAVRDFSDIRTTIKLIIERYNLSILKTSLAAYNSNPSLAKSRVQDFIGGRTNFGVYLLDKEAEEFQQIQMSLGGLDDLLSRYTEIICLETQIPATKLLGISPRGFSTNDESGHRNWYDLIDGLREILLKPIIKKLRDLILLNEGLAIDDEIDVEFGKLMESNKLEDAQIKEIESRTNINYMNAGVLSPNKILETLANDPESGYENLEVDNDLEDLADLAEPRDIEISRKSSNGNEK